MATNEKDYNEILLQAMDTLIQHRLQGLEFDRTVKCQIIQDKGQGVFIVKENDSVQYEASATNTVNAPEYKVDDWVYVLIPSGDYSRYKMIVGKYTDDNRNNPVAYVPPLGTVVSMTNNINTTTNSEGILANGDLQIKELGIIDLSTNASDDIKYNAIYDTLALTASFKTLFNNASMVSGNYGLLLRLIEDDGSETAVLLDSSEMFGDPYNYSIYLKQSKAFDISALDNLSKIRVALYQQKNFEYYDESKGENAEYPKDGVAPNNIFVKDIIITLGQDVKTIPDNQFRINVVDGILEYTGSQKKVIRSTWYNKTEDNEFIGFSDGVVDTSYDEDAYMDSYENDWLGMSIKKDDILSVKESLQIYANTQRIEEKTDLIINYLNKDIYSIFQEMANYILSDPEQRDEVLKLFTKDIEILKAIKIAEFYETYLNNCFNYKEPTEETVKSDAKSCCDNIAVDIKNFTGTLNRIKTFLDMVFVPLIKQDMDLSTYVGTQMRRIQPFQNKIEILKKEIIDLCAQSNASPDTKYQEGEKELRAGLIKNLVDRIINDDLIPIEQEYEDFVKANKNKYCIYWYEKDLAAAGDRWVEAGWKRTTDFENGTPGMPATNEEDTKYPKTSSNPYSYTTDPNLATDSVKAILFYNHIKYESNILEFKNLEPPQDTTQADIADAVYIEHNNNSEGSYQKYNSTYGLVSAVDGLLNRALKVRYDGFAQGDEGLIGTTAYWYVPNQATMLTYDKVKLIGAGYNDLEDIIKSITDPNEQVPDTTWKHLAHQRAGFKCFYKDIKQEAGTEPAKPLESDTLFYYMIAKVFNPVFSQNTIYCVINKDGFDYEGSINFTFSTFGTSGTDYTVSIVPAGTQYAVEPSDPLELKIGFSYLDGLTVENSPTPGLGWYGPHKLTYTEYVPPGPKDKEKLGSCSIRASNLTGCLYNVLKCEVKWTEINEETPANQTLTLSSVYPVAIASEPYYLEGATTVIYDDQGTSPTYYNKKYKLFKRHTNEEVKNVTWEIIHYNKNGDQFTYNNKESKLELSNVEKFLPKLEIVKPNASFQFKEPGAYLKPLNMYMSDLEIYSVVVAKDSNGNILLAQPIYIGQHRWGSTLLNSWNESLTIDEENGTILSTMMGAGYKDGDNAFYGVLMGDVATTVGDKTTITPGLYGFHAGAQSFAWKVDGTGFIGKSGRGRIEFDGTKGIIRSSSFNMTNGSAGTEIDLDDGKITLKGAEFTRVDPDDENSAIITCEKGSNSLIQLNVISPYFKINSKDGNTLMLVGDTSMYLQSNNYVSADDNTEDNPAEGMKIDLNDGHIDAYNFKLTSGSINLNSNPEKSDSDYYINAGNGLLSLSGSGIFKIDTQKFKINSSPNMNENYLSIGNENNYIKYDNNNQLMIKSSNFALQTETIQIDSSGNPAYLDIKHSYEDGIDSEGNPINKYTSVFKIGADGTFMLNSVPLSSIETINYYVIINSKEDEYDNIVGFNYRSGTLNSDGTVTMGDRLGTYKYDTAIPVTSINPYPVFERSGYFAYQSVDDTWFYCAIGTKLCLELESHQDKEPNAQIPSTTDPTTFIAFKGWVTGSLTNQMSIDLKQGAMSMGGGTQIYLDKNHKQIWASTDNRSLNITATESTPFALGGFSIGWDGQLTGTKNNKHKWYIKPDGGASFGWLSSGSISCSSATCNSLKAGGYNVPSKLGELESWKEWADKKIRELAGL